MTAQGLNPTFATARGTVNEWLDPRGSRRALEHFARRYHGQKIALMAASRTSSVRLGHWTDGFPILSSDDSDVWDGEGLVHQVRVFAPDSSLTLALRPQGAILVPLGKTVVNPRFRRFQTLAGSGVTHESVRLNDRLDHDDLDRYCYGPHTREALALLQPRCFFHGRDPLWPEQVETIVIGRSAYVLPMRCMIPLTDPRSLGDWQNPTVFNEAEHTEVVVDRERNVVLEWRALFDGEAYERHYFTDLHFDEPMSEEEFVPQPRSAP